MFKRMLQFLMVILIAFPSVSSLFHSGYFPMHDDIQTMRVYEMDKCFKDGQIPCRWVPDMGYGYGYPQFNYYAPLPYYVMEIFHLLGFSVIDSVKLGFLLGLYLSSWGMFVLAKSLWNSTFAGLVSSLFYTYFPYHAVDVYVRGAMGETWALAMMPFLFFSIYELVIKSNKKALLYLALSTAGLMTSHNVSTLIFAPFCLLWLIFLHYQKYGLKKLLKTFKQTMFSVGWGLGLAAFFVLPAWFEKKFVHVETITQGYFGYQAHFVGLKQLLFSSYWGYGASNLGNFDGLSLSVGPLWWMLPTILALIFLYFKRKEKYSTFVLLIFAWIALFMVHSKSDFIWHKIKLLNFVQFPWRFLGPALFFFSLIAGTFILLVKNKKILLLSTVILLVGFYSGFFRPSKYLEISDNNKFSGQSWLEQQTISIYDYLPIYADQPPASQAPKTLEGVVVKYDEVGSNWRRWNIIVSENKTDVVLPIFYFPGWVIEDNGNKVEVNQTPKTGTMTINVDKGEHEIYAYLKNTPIRKFSNVLSLFSLLLILFYRKIENKLYE